MLRWLRGLPSADARNLALACCGSAFGRRPERQGRRDARWRNTAVGEGLLGSRLADYRAAHECPRAITPLALVGRMRLLWAAADVRSFSPKTCHACSTPSAPHSKHL